MKSHRSRRFGLADRVTPARFRSGINVVVFGVVVFGIVIIGLMVFGWPLAGAAASESLSIHDVTEHSGIRFIHTDGSSGRHYLIEAVSAGVATFDYDDDGDVDIYFLNGAPLKGTETGDGATEQTPRNALYRNDGDLRFTDVTAEAGVGDDGYGLGVVAGDFDNDGHQDLYVNNFGPNILYRNNGDGSFRDVTNSSGTTNGDKVGAGVSFLDADHDGDLDLYVASYIKFSYADHKDSIFHGRVVYPGPVIFPKESDDYYRNNGDGTFTNASQEAGIADFHEWGMGTLAADLDDDGDTDIFVANDSTRNLYFENDGSGRFTEKGLFSGLAFDQRGEALGSMGVDCADFDNDGHLDLYSTSYQKQLAVLYRNRGRGFFQDVTQRTGAGRGTYHHVNWGVGFADLDQDGDRDLFVAHGHIHDNLDEFDDTTSYRVANQFFLNEGGRRFVEILAGGDGLSVIQSSRGAAFDDLDNDGDIDAVILNSRSRPTMLETRAPANSHWLQIRLHGTRANRDGVGARVTIMTGGKRQIAEVIHGRGYQSHYGACLHFGLADATRVEQISIRWPGGDVQWVEGLEADQRIEVIQE